MGYPLFKYRRLAEPLFDILNNLKNNYAQNIDSYTYRQLTMTTIVAN